MLERRGVAHGAIGANSRDLIGPPTLIAGRRIPAGARRIRASAAGGTRGFGEATSGAQLPARSMGLDPRGTRAPGARR